jgi:hypothetical protein
MKLNIVQKINVKIVKLVIVKKKSITILHLLGLGEHA